MEIVFRTYINTDDANDDIFEQYEADITVDEGSPILSILTDESEVSYEDFKADVFETILEGVLERQGETLMVHEEEPITDDIWFEDDIFDDDSGYQIFFNDNGDEDLGE